MESKLRELLVGGDENPPVGVSMRKQDGVALVRGVSLRSPYVVECQLRMILDDVRWRAAGRQLAQNVLDRDPRAPDRRLADHDRGIPDDPFVRHGCSSLTSPATLAPSANDAH